MANQIDQHPQVLAEGSHPAGGVEPQLRLEEALLRRLVAICQEAEKTQAKIPATASRKS